MQITFISDTHAQHHDLPPLGSGDVLVHCGDFTGNGSLEQAQDFAMYMAAQNFRHKVVIAGNHDWCFEDERRLEAEACFQQHGLIYLNEAGITLDGVKFWGSPIQPDFYRWAFQRQRGAAIRQHWDLIPLDTDVLLTHGPAFGVLDLCLHGGRAGCEELREAVFRVKPKLFAFGHIHEDYGRAQHEETTYINACSMDGHYCISNPPIQVELSA